MSESKKSYMDGITTNNIVLFVLNNNSFPQIFRFPKKILTEQLAKILYTTHGTIIGENSPDEIDLDLLLNFEQKLEDNLGYCLHTINDNNGYPQPTLQNPMIFNKPITVFSYAYMDPSNLPNDSDDSDDSLDVNIDALEVDL